MPLGSTNSGRRHVRSGRHSPKRRRPRPALNVPPDPPPHDGRRERLMPRYRVFTDILDPKGILDTQQVRGIVQEILEKATLAPSSEQKRNGITLEIVPSRYTEDVFHQHVSNDDQHCESCSAQRADKRN
jgi:hypothetical protein